MIVNFFQLYPTSGGFAQQQVTISGLPEKDPGGFDYGKVKLLCGEPHVIRLLSSDHAGVYHYRDSFIKLEQVLNSLRGV